MIEIISDILMEKCNELGHKYSKYECDIICNEDIEGYVAKRNLTIIRESSDK